MTQKQIRRRCEVIKAKMGELYWQISRLKDELTNLQKQCAHSSRSQLKEPSRWGKAEQCDDCEDCFFYKSSVPQKVKAWKIQAFYFFQSVCFFIYKIQKGLPPSF